MTAANVEILVAMMAGPYNCSRTYGSILAAICNDIHRYQLQEEILMIRKITHRVCRLI